MNLSLQDVEFLLDCVERSEKTYQEKSIKYHKEDGYLENIYRPKLLQFDEMKQRLRERRLQLKKEN